MWIVCGCCLIGGFIAGFIAGFVVGVCFVLDLDEKKPDKKEEQPKLGTMW